MGQSLALLCFAETQREKERESSLMVVSCSFKMSAPNPTFAHGHHIPILLVTGG